MNAAPGVVALDGEQAILLEQDQVGGFADFHPPIRFT